MKSIKGISLQSFIDSGKAGNKGSFDKAQLAKGTDVEQEHLEGESLPPDAKRVVGRKISKDHLTEDPKYYSHLERMEDKYKKAAAISNINAFYNNSSSALFNQAVRNLFAKQAQEEEVDAQGKPKKKKKLNNLLAMGAGLGAAGLGGLIYYGYKNGWFGTPQVKSTPPKDVYQGNRTTAQEKHKDIMQSPVEALSEATLGKPTNNPQDPRHLVPMIQNPALSAAPGAIGAASKILPGSSVYNAASAGAKSLASAYPKAAPAINTAARAAKFVVNGPAWASTPLIFKTPATAAAGGSLGAGLAAIEMGLEAGKVGYRGMQPETQKKMWESSEPNSGLIRNFLGNVIRGGGYGPASDELLAMNNDPNLSIGERQTANLSQPITTLGTLPRQTFGALHDLANRQDALSRYGLPKETDYLKQYKLKNKMQ